MTGVTRIGPGTARRSTIRGGQDRGVVVARHRAVAPRAADVDPVRREALLGDLDRVEPAAGDRHRHAAALVERAGRAQPLGPVLGDPARPGSAAGLLVGRAREQDVAAQAGDRVARRIEAGRAGLGDEPLDDAELHRDHVLHVDRAAAVDVAVGDVGRERVVGPALRRRRDDVEVRQQEERLAAGPVAAQPGVDRAAARHRLDDLRLAGPSAAQAVLEVARDAQSRRRARRVGGGLIDGIRMRSRRVSTSRSWAAAQSPRSIAPTGGRGGHAGSRPAGRADEGDERCR